MLLDELARQREALPPARDRLLTTTFLVASLHALVILGVTFSPSRPSGAPDAPSLEVLLVHDPVAEKDTNSHPDYLAQVNQRGAGTAADVRGAQSPHSLPADPGRDGPGDADGAARAGPDSERDLLATRAHALEQQHMAHGGMAAASGSPLVLEPLSPQTSGADRGAALALRGPTEHELLVTANTRESGVAVYLDAWRRKIERIGTANYPLDAVRRVAPEASPVIEIQLLADGRLGEARIQRSSGYAEIDQAALGILRLAEPFEPFPRALAARHDALRLVYEWQFLGGVLTGSTVRVPEDTR